MSGQASALSILTWHSISEGPGPTRMPPTVFREQLDALAATGCAVLALDEAASRLLAGRVLPPRAVVLTFDDGFEDFSTVAFPALAARRWPSTLFLPAARLGGRSDWEGMPAAQVQPLLDWGAVAALAAQGVAIGSHGLTHRDLAHAPLDDAEFELGESRRELETRLGCRVTAFAYPFGRSSPALRAAVARHYAVAVGTTMQRAERDADRHGLPRIDMTYFRDAARLQRFLEQGRSAYFTARRVLRRAGQALRG